MNHRKAAMDLLHRAAYGESVEFSPAQAEVLVSDMLLLYQFASACASEEGPNHLDMAAAQKWIAANP